MIIIAEFDGMLCADKYPEIGEPDLKFIEWLKNEQKNGHMLGLQTSRSGKLLNDAVEWCRCYGLEFDEINGDLPDWLPAEAE